MKWTIIIPTVRPKQSIAPTLAMLYSTLTKETDVLVLDGSYGKSVTLNRQLNEATRLEKNSGFYATIDDDVYMPYGWQDDLERAFIDVPYLGACGAFYGYSTASVAYMTEVNHGEQHFKTLFHPLRTCNLAGACFVTTLETALKIGEYPHDFGTHYEFNEDGWRSQRVRDLDLDLGYVRCRYGDAGFVQYADSAEYLAMKAADTEIIRANL